jgi:hypothetical protein
MLTNEARPVQRLVGCRYYPPEAGHSSYGEL